MRDVVADDTERYHHWTEKEKAQCAYRWSSRSPMSKGRPLGVDANSSTVNTAAGLRLHRGTKRVAVAGIDDDT